MKTSTEFAFVTKHKLPEKAAVKTAITSKRKRSDLMEYRITIPATGSTEARTAATEDVRRVIPAWEYSTVLANHSLSSGSYSLSINRGLKTC